MDYVDLTLNNNCLCIIEHILSLHMHGKPGRYTTDNQIQISDLF